MNARISTDLHFIAGVYYNGTMQMNSYMLKLWMITASTEPESHNIAFERIKYFLSFQIENSIFINKSHQTQCEKFTQAGLKIITIPVEPVDQVVGILLHHKLNAIMEGRMIVVETELSSMLGDNMTYLHSDAENVDIVDKSSWWMLPDLIQPNDELLSTDKVLTLNQSKSWRDLDLAWGSDTVDEESGNTIVFADFNRGDNDTK